MFNRDRVQRVAETLFVEGMRQYVAQCLKMQVTQTPEEIDESAIAIANSSFKGALVFERVADEFAQRGYDLGSV